MDLISRNIDQISNICAKHEVEHLFLFGSVNTVKFNDQSDIDILVQFSLRIDPIEYFRNYMDFKEELESLLKRNIDIVEDQAVRNPFSEKFLIEIKFWFMNERVLKSLFDIKLAIQEIESFLPSIKLTYLDYKSNLILKRAVERNLEIIGEAMNRIIKEDQDIPITEAYRIVGLRNQIIHSYDSISDENIWAIIVNHIPRLKTEVDNLTKEYE